MIMKSPTYAEAAQGQKSEGNITDDGASFDAKVLFAVNPTFNSLNKEIPDFDKDPRELEAVCSGNAPPLSKVAGEQTPMPTPTPDLFFPGLSTKQGNIEALYKKMEDYEDLNSNRTYVPWA
jgi:hypothetical protein